MFINEKKETVWEGSKWRQLHGYLTGNGDLHKLTMAKGLCIAFHVSLYSLFHASRHFRPWVIARNSSIIVHCRTLYLQQQKAVEKIKKNKKLITSFWVILFMLLSLSLVEIIISRNIEIVKFVVFMFLWKCKEVIELPRALVDRLGGPLKLFRLRRISMDWVVR